MKFFTRFLIFCRVSRGAAERQKHIAERMREVDVHKLRVPVAFANKVKAIGSPKRILPSPCSEPDPQSMRAE